MARVKITEYRAKRMLLGEAYRGHSVSFQEISNVPKKGAWVVKVDEGIKKRMLKGLALVDVASAKAAAAMRSWKKAGFSQFLLEEFVPHEKNKEHYLSIDRMRDGLLILYSDRGGIDIESSPESVQRFLIEDLKDVSSVAKKTTLPEAFLSHCVSLFNETHVAFLEINPLVVKDGRVIPLDAAVLVDDTAEFFVRGQWSGADIVRSLKPGGKVKHEGEVRVEKLAATTPAALKLNVLNENGSLFFLLSGGGGSIVIADEIAGSGGGKLIGNYGEYSGGPSREETYLYAREVIGLMLASVAKKKALVIAGGIANFTDIKSTFAGIIDALREVVPQLQKLNVKVFVRRGGPREAEGLAEMHTFLRDNKILGSTHGSGAPIILAAREALAYVS